MKPIIITILLLFMQPVLSEGIVYPGPIKPVNCDNATTREDGTALPATQIKKVEIGFSANADASVPVHFISLEGGCQARDYDMSINLTPGQWYTVGWTIACDNDDWETAGCTNEQYSKPSDIVPFIYALPAKARPDAPTITQ